MSSLCSDAVIFVSLSELWPSREGASLVSQPCALPELIKSYDSAEVFCNPQVKRKINGISKFVKAMELRDFSGIVTDFT